MSAPWQAQSNTSSSLDDSSRSSSSGANIVEEGTPYNHHQQQQQQQQYATSSGAEDQHIISPPPSSADSIQFSTLRDGPIPSPPAEQLFDQLHLVEQQQQQHRSTGRSSKSPLRPRSHSLRQRDQQQQQHPHPHHPYNNNALPHLLHSRKGSTEHHHPPFHPSSISRAVSPVLQPLYLHHPLVSPVTPSDTSTGTANSSVSASSTPWNTSVPSATSSIAARAPHHPTLSKAVSFDQHSLHRPLYQCVGVVQQQLQQQVQHSAPPQHNFQQRQLQQYQQHQHTNSTSSTHSRLSTAGSIGSSATTTTNTSSDSHQPRYSHSYSGSGSGRGSGSFTFPGEADFSDSPAGSSSSGYVLAGDAAAATAALGDTTTTRPSTASVQDLASTLGAANVFSSSWTLDHSQQHPIIAAGSSGSSSDQSKLLDQAALTPTVGAFDTSIHHHHVPPPDYSITGGLVIAGMADVSHDRGDSPVSGDDSRRMYDDGASGSSSKISHGGKASAGRFVCHVCGQGFQRKNGLSRHMRSHTGEKPFACTFCKFKSTRTDSLQRHMKLHLNQGDEPPSASAASGRASFSHHQQHSHAAFADAANLMSMASAHPSMDSRASASSASGFPGPYDGYGHAHPHAIPSGAPGPGGSGGSYGAVGRKSSQPQLSSITTSGLNIRGGGARSAAPGGAGGVTPAAKLGRGPSTSIGSHGSSFGPPPPAPMAGGPPPPPSAFDGPLSASAAMAGASHFGRGDSGLDTPSHHRAVWNAQNREDGAAGLIIPPRGNLLPSPHQGHAHPAQGPGAHAHTQGQGEGYAMPAMEGFPATERFDFGRLFSPGLNDETNLGFGSYITQAASIFSPARHVSMADQQAHGAASVVGLAVDDGVDPLLAGPAGGVSSGYGNGMYGLQHAIPPASPPPSNRHLSLFVNNFARHLPFIHAPTIPRLYEDILDTDGSLRTTSQAKQIDGLKPCTEDLLRAMAIVGAHYDGSVAFASRSDDEAGKDADGTASTHQQDLYGAAELKAKLLGDFADNPPSSTRATFATHEHNAAGGAAAGLGSAAASSAGAGDGASNDGSAGAAAGTWEKDYLEEATLLRRAQSLALVQFVSLFSKSRPHQNHARLLHGALITIGRELLQETQHRENLARQRTNRTEQLSDYEQWREWVRRTERKRTLWAISVCDVLQSILFHVPPWLSASELGSLEVGDLGDDGLWEATSAPDWQARKATLPPQPMENDSLSKRSFTIRNLVRSLLEVAEDPNTAVGSTSSSASSSTLSGLDARSAASARLDPASKLGTLGPCARFSAILALCGHAVEVGRMDYASRHQLRQQAGLPQVPLSENQALAISQAQASLGSFSEEDLASFQYDVEELDSKLLQEASKIDNGLQRWFAKAGLTQSIGGSRPCITETMALYYAAQHYVLQLRRRVQHTLPWDASHGSTDGSVGAGSEYPFLDGVSNGANLLSSVSRGNGQNSLVTVFNLIGAEAASPNTPDDVMRLIVRIRRSLKSIDGGAALLGYLGSPLLTECAMEWGQGKDFEPDIDGATFLGFFPRLD